MRSVTRVNPVAMLSRIARAHTATVREQCELCKSTLGPGHRHVLEMLNRKVVCACEACALRFPPALQGRFKLIPRDCRALPEFRMTDAQWESLALPINLAFLFHDSATGKITALYPSPAGATESLLPLPSWQALTADNPVLAEMEPDVEALLVNRVGDARRYYLAPMDVCYELAGLIRVHWRGFSGGEKVWEEIEAFFARLEAQAEPVRSAPEEGSHA